MSAIPRAQDAFGRALMDHLRGRAVPIVIEREDGYIDVGSTAEYFDPASRWPAHQRRALRFARGRILDVGSGAGRHALHLQAKGQAVVAIDSSPLAVKVCRARGVRDARILPVDDIPKFRERFDTILMLGNNLGLFGSRIRGRRLLRRFFDITTDRARVIAETLDPLESPRPVHRRYHRQNRRRGRLPGQVRIRIRYQLQVGAWFDYLFVGPDDLADLVHCTGWRVARLIHSTDSRYVAILEKAG